MKQIFLLLLAIGVNASLAKADWPGPAAVMVPLGNPPNFAPDGPQDPNIHIYSTDEVIEAHRSKMMPVAERDQILEKLEIPHYDTLDDLGRDELFFSAEALNWEAFSKKHPGWNQSQYEAIRKVNFFAEAGHLR